MSNRLNDIYYQLWSWKQLSWLSYFPGADLKSIGSNNADLSLVSNLDENNLFWEQMTREHFNLVNNNRSYGYTTSETWNKPYRENFRKLARIVRPKEFFATLNNVLKNNLGIKSLLFNNEEYSLENLISSSSQFDDDDNGWLIFQSLNTASKIELMKIIFGNKRSIEQGVKDVNQLQQRFDETKRKLLTDLQTALKKLQEVDPKTVQLPINGKKYTINQLLQARTQLLNDQLDQKVIDQIKPLFSNSIYATDITKVIDQLKKYKDIFLFLTKLATEQKLTSLKINDQNYSFAALIADLKKEFINFSQDSFTELQSLVDQDISLKKLETAYQESLPSTENKSEAKSSTKKSTNQNLAIGLGTAGGVVALAGVGGFVYWFVKIRKS